MIKRVAVSDLDRIVALRVNIFKEYGKIINDVEERRMIKINHDYFFRLYSEERLHGFYEEDNERIISIALAVLLDYPPINFDDLGKCAYIFNVFTDENYRNQGKSLQILTNLIASLKKARIRHFSLDANQLSMNLYRELGFLVPERHMELRIHVDKSRLLPEG